MTSANPKVDSPDSVSCLYYPMGSDVTVTYL